MTVIHVRCKCFGCGGEITENPRPWWVKHLQETQMFHENCLKDWIG